MRLCRNRKFIVSSCRSVWCKRRKTISLLECNNLCIKLDVACKSHGKCVTKKPPILYRTEVCKRNKLCVIVNSKKCIWWPLGKQQLSNWGVKGECFYSHESAQKEAEACVPDQGTCKYDRWSTKWSHFVIKQFVQIREIFFAAGCI